MYAMPGRSKRYQRCEKCGSAIGPGDHIALISPDEIPKHLVWCITCLKNTLDAMDWFSGSAPK
jgi:hypothetical protein